MKLIRILFLVFILGFQGFAQEKININFKDLKIMDLIKITSKIIDKNILVTEQINGNVDFISNKSLDRDELIKILGFVLEDKGYSLAQSGDILRILKLDNTANSNVPIVNNTNNNLSDVHISMVTEIFTVYNANVDYVALKIRHLISKNGKMVTNKESNTLVITDFIDNIETVKEVVSIMTSGAKKDISIVELKNMKAVNAKKSLNAIVKSLYNNKIETEKVAIIDNKNNNSLVLIGKKENIIFLEKYIKNADLKDSLIKKEVKVFPLKNVEALNIIKILDSIIGKKVYINPNNKPLSSVDEESNSIVIMGPSDELEYLSSLLEELDKDKLQVFVQAKIIEVSENKTKDIGLKYGFGAGSSGSNGIFSFASNLGGEILPLKSLISFDETLIKGLALGATLNLLKQNQAIDIVSEPSVLCINNKESSIYVGETKSFQTSSLTDSTSLNSSNSFKREDIGLTLKVKPRISNENKVTLEIETILEDAKELKMGQTNPDTTKKVVKTSAIVTNGEAVIIGGLIKNKSDIINDDVPFFSKIPILGNLFKNTRKINDKINLVVIVTPYIIPKSKDLSYIRNQLSQLSQLEDKYTKELEIRLQENKLIKDKEDLERLKRKNELQKEKEEFKEERKDYLDSKNTFSATISNTKTDDRTEHEKRVAEILGY